MDSQNNGGGLNSVLIFFLLLIILFFGYKFLTQKSEAPTNEADSDIVNIDLSLGEENGEALPQ